MFYVIKIEIIVHNWSKLVLIYCYFKYNIFTSHQLNTARQIWCSFIYILILGNDSFFKKTN